VVKKATSKKGTVAAGGEPAAKENAAPPPSAAAAPSPLALDGGEGPSLPAAARVKKPFTFARKGDPLRQRPSSKPAEKVAEKPQVEAPAPPPRPANLADDPFAFGENGPELPPPSAAKTFSRKSPGTTHGGGALTELD
jgi:hypothetical protein